ncbi:MAG: hypothetical protein L3J71_01005 [Victivallaceae bacterium]|nr:hypothetical protein [Victivallaceae bacterium]
MNIETEVRKLINRFEEKYPELKGKAYLTSSNRTWQEQLDIILGPDQQANYPNIKRDFKTAFGYEKLPDTRTELNSTELQWWEREIMLQAGMSPGFPHVGGRAQDVSVKNLTLAERKRLKVELAPYFGILLEKISGTKSVYGVDVTEANLFHLYKK